MQSEIVVLFGSASSERRVSVASAQNVVEQLGGPQAWFWAPSGEVFPVTPEELARHEQPFERDFRPRRPALAPAVEEALDLPMARSRVFLLAVHGAGAEDGPLQALFEARGLAFTGSGSRASAAAFDKQVARRLVQAQGVACAEAAQLDGDEARIQATLEAMLRVHRRVVVKPVADGSSVGLHHLRSAANAAQVAGEVAATGKVHLAESFISGTELTVGVVDGRGGARALPPSEVRVDPGAAFDFGGKYLGTGATEVTPAEVSPDVTRAAQALALAAHRALGCEGYTRTDLIVSSRGPVFLETNTLPGMTRRSFIPQQLAAESTNVREFLEGQIALAKERRDGNRG